MDIVDLIENGDGEDAGDFLTWFEQNKETALRALFSGDTSDLAAAVSSVNSTATAEDIEEASKPKTEVVLPILGGQWLLDPNEVNGWGTLGPVDNTNSQDFGNADGTGGTQPEDYRFAGGYMFPWDMRVKKINVWHRDNSATALAWNWFLFKQQKIDGAGGAANGDIMWTGTPTDYANTNPQNTMELGTNMTDDLLPADTVLSLAVEAPTAITTNRYVQVMSGYVLLERV